VKSFKIQVFRLRQGYGGQVSFKRAALLVSAFFILHSSFGQTVLTAPGLASFKKKAASGGGGGGGGPCPADGSPTVAQTGTTDAFDVNSDAPYIGMIYTNGPASTNLCKVRCKITAQANTVGATLTVRVYAMSGTSISAGSPLGETTGIAGDNAWSLTDVVFTFASDVTLSAGTKYAIVLTGNGGTGTGQYAKLEKGTTAISGTLEAWHSSGTTFGLAGGGTTPSFALYLH
jgi:hypothetical protein